MHSFLETILLICSLPYIPFFFYYYANAFGRISILLKNCPANTAYFCLQTFSFCSCKHKQQVWSIQENRLRIKFTYSLDILWRHLENTEFAGLSYLKLGFYFHWVFTKTASIGKDLAALELHCPADLWYDRWDQLSCFKWQSPQEDRERRRLFITYNPSKHKSGFSKTCSVQHNFHTYYPTKYSLNHYGVRTNGLRTSVLRTVTSLSLIKRPRQALQCMVRKPWEAWVEAGLFIIPTMEEDIQVRREMSCGRGSKPWWRQGWGKTLEFTCLILHPSSPPVMFLDLGLSCFSSLPSLLSANTNGQWKLAMHIRWEI